VTLRVGVHPSQLPTSVDTRLAAALSQRVVPSRLLYDSHAQAGRWLAYHDAWSPARTSDDVRSIYGRLAADVASSGHLPTTFVSLGAGGGQKDVDVMRALGSRRYLPVETSLALAATSALAARVLDVEVEPWLIDLEASLERSVFGDEPVVFGCFGMVPNFPLASFLSRLGALLRPDDRLLLSANLSPRPLADHRPDIVDQYDNPQGRAWIAGGLAELGLAGSDYELVVEPRPIAPDGRTWRIDVAAHLRRAVPLRLPFLHVDWQAGDRVQAFFSNRLAADYAADVLTAHTGLVRVAEAVAADGSEGAWAMAPPG
jgi:hypothetical protein